MSEHVGSVEIPPCLSVVIPVFNEKATIEKIVTLVLAQRLVRELILVDDGSNDGTEKILPILANTDPRLRLCVHKHNRGKGAAVRTALEKASSTIVLIQDADLEYNPSEYDLLLKPILSGKADVVFSSRFIGGDAHRLLYFWHYLGNRLLTMLLNAAINLNLTDMESGYKVFRRDAINKIQLVEDRFGFEPEIVAKLARLHLRIYEVAVSYDGRTYDEGKKVTWHDGLAALYCIFKYGFLRM